MSRDACALVVCFSSNPSLQISSIEHQLYRQSVTVKAATLQMFSAYLHRLWHITQQQCLCVFQHPDFVTSIAFHPKVCARPQHLAPVCMFINRNHDSY
jgi:hypothetical protein